MMLALLLAMQAAGQPVPAEIVALPTTELARRVLQTPPDGIVAHRWSRDPHSGQVDSLHFYAEPRPLGPRLCRRRVYMLAFGPLRAAIAVSGTGTPIALEQLALTVDCTTAGDERFGYVQPPAALDAAATTLRWLADRQRRGGANGVTCLPAGRKPDPCDRGAAAALAALPLDRIFLINRGNRPGEWALSIMPTGPGQLFYDVRLMRGDGQKPVMTIRWTAPAPF